VSPQISKTELTKQLCGLKWKNVALDPERINSEVNILRANWQQSKEAIVRIATR